jgi:hypothetical protein
MKRFDYVLDTNGVLHIRSGGGPKPTPICRRFENTLSECKTVNTFEVDSLDRLCPKCLLEALAETEYDDE